MHLAATPLRYASLDVATDALPGKIKLTFLQYWGEQFGVY